MNPDDELSFGLIDDPTPPAPDAARLQKAVARGRQRLIRRRAIFGSVAGSVALVLVGSGVAVAQHKDAAPQVQVQPTTTTTSTLPTPGTVHEADMNGLHYTLTLATPVVPAGGTVRVTLHVENRTKVSSSRSACSFGITVVDPERGQLLPVSDLCARPAVAVGPGESFDATVSTLAPAQPSSYAVEVGAETDGVLPPAFLQNPFDLKVVPTHTSAPTTPSSANPGISDFVGTLTARDSTTTVGRGVEVSLTVRNNTDHTIEGARGSLPNTLGLVCTNDLSSDGHTNRALQSEENLFFVTIPPLAPGDNGGRSGSYVPTPDDIGTVTCEAVLLQTSAQWQAGTVTSAGRLTNIPPVTFTVAAGTDASTTSTTPNESPTTTSTSS